MIGYSGTPLPRKLGIKPGHRVLLDHAPTGFDLHGLPDDVSVQRRRGRHPYDVILTFCGDLATYQNRLRPLTDAMVVNGSLWIGWPKKSSPMASDIDENLVRDTALAAGLVDVKVCAIDADWSGLKLVRRQKDR